MGDFMTHVPHATYDKSLEQNTCNLSYTCLDIVICEEGFLVVCGTYVASWSIMLEKELSVV